MNNNSTGNQGSPKGSQGSRDDHDGRKAQPGGIDPSSDIDTDDREEGTEQTDERRAEGTERGKGGENSSQRQAQGTEEESEDSSAPSRSASDRDRK